MKRVNIGYTESGSRYFFYEVDATVTTPSTKDIPANIFYAWRVIEDLNAVVQKQLSLLDDENSDDPVSRDDLVQQLETAIAAAKLAAATVWPSV